MSTQDLSRHAAHDWSQLPFLLRLIDDASPAVREKIALRLRALGPEVWRQIEVQQLPLSASARHALREILSHSRSTPVAAAWPDWLGRKGENERLEAALIWLAERDGVENGGARLRGELDEASRDYLHQGGLPDPEELAEWLFQKRGLRGADADEYSDPRASDLLHVLEGGGGLPITLTCGFILIGWRLDLVIYGCNYPGHFLARAPLAPGHEYWGDAVIDKQDFFEDLIFDPFHGGRILAAPEVAALRRSAPEALSTPAKAHEIIARVLRNKANAWYHHGDMSQTREVLALLAQLEDAVSSH